MEKVIIWNDKFYAFNENNFIYLGKNRYYFVIVSKEFAKNLYNLEDKDIIEFIEGV